jgi:Spy/CpxP family protein refolding chaperone
MKRLWTLLISLTIVLASPFALAQQGGKDVAAKRAKVAVRMKQIRTQVLRKEVGLDEKKAAEVVKILEKYQPTRQKLQIDARTQRRALRDLLDKDSNDQPAYDKAIKGLRSTQKKLQDLREKEADELTKVLTPKQQAKLAVAIRKVQAKLRKQRRDRDDG